VWEFQCYFCNGGNRHHEDFENNRSRSREVEWLNVTNSKTQNEQYQREGSVEKCHYPIQYRKEKEWDITDVYKTYTPRIQLWILVGICKSSMTHFRSPLVLLTDVCMPDGHLFYKLHKQSLQQEQNYIFMSFTSTCQVFKFIFYWCSKWTIKTEVLLHSYTMEVHLLNLTF